VIICRDVTFPFFSKNVESFYFSSLPKKSFRRNLCGIKNAKYDGAYYIVNEGIQQHMYQLINYYVVAVSVSVIGG
jgi:hypothetical protein